MPSPPPSVNPRFDGTRFLIVDDDFDSAEAVCLVLTHEGCDVRVGANANEAVRIVTDLTPEVALLDIGLPGIDGYELVKALRTIPTLSASRFVAITGYDGPEMEQQGREAGFDAHLVRPVAISTLLDVVARYATSEQSA